MHILAYLTLSRSGKPVHTRSIGRWRRYEKQLDLMRKTLQEKGVPIDDD